MLDVERSMFNDLDEWRYTNDEEDRTVARWEIPEREKGEREYFLCVCGREGYEQRLPTPIPFSANKFSLMSLREIRVTG